MCLFCLCLSVCLSVKIAAKYRVRVFSVSQLKLVLCFRCSLFLCILVLVVLCKPILESDKIFTAETYMRMCVYVYVCVCVGVCMSTCVYV